MRQWLKFYSNWPTFPQVYTGRQFVGGVDIVLEMIEGDEFLEVVPKECQKEEPQVLLERFIKGNNVGVILDEESKDVLEVLHNNGVQYSVLDVKKNEGVRAFLKEQTGLDALPIVTVKGKGINGEDIVNKAKSD